MRLGALCAALFAVTLMGCGKGEEAKPESPTSQAAAKEAAAGLSPEQAAAFKKANEEARGTGAEPSGSGTPGEK